MDDLIHHSLFVDFCHNTGNHFFENRVNSLKTVTKETDREDGERRYRKGSFGYA